MIQIRKCECGKTGCDRYEILGIHQSSFSKVQLAEIRDEIEDFLTFPPTEIKEIPQFQGTMEALDKLTIITPTQQ